MAIVGHVISVVLIDDVETKNKYKVMNNTRVEPEGISRDYRLIHSNNLHWEPTMCPIMH